MAHTPNTPPQDWPADPLISTQTLERWIAEKRSFALFDATWHMPDKHRNAKGEYEDAHIRGAGFFDIDGLSDPKSPLPHTMPKPKSFSKMLGQLGLMADVPIVFYDNSQHRTACRAWCMLKSMGHPHIYVLDGGMTAWRNAALPVRAGDASVGEEKAYQPVDPLPLFVKREDVANTKSLVIDARSAGRFTGEEPEKNQGIRSGHIPGSINRPYEKFFTDRGFFLPKEDLAKLLPGKNAKPVITTCGSGITACILAFTLFRLGKTDVQIYDGSWVEWGNTDPSIAGDQDWPVETGPGSER